MNYKFFIKEYIKPYLKKNDKPYNRELFNNSLDFAFKEGLITLKQSYNWVYPNTKMFE